MPTTKGNGWEASVGDRASSAGQMGIAPAYESS